MIPLLTSQQMAQADRLTMEQLGLPGMVLMENAGAGVVTVIQDHYPQAHRFLILAGRGNNGGDGFVIARRLHQQGHQVKLVLFSQMVWLKGDALLHAQVYHKVGGWLKELTDTSLPEDFSSLLAHSDVVVDALFGTGLSKPLAGIFAEVVEKVNYSGKPVVAVDIASGVNSDNGAILGVAMQAAHTVTFGAEKIGHYTWPGAGMCGKVVLVDIGIDKTFLQAEYHPVGKNGPHDLEIPRRRQDGHKGSFGHLLVVAGSVGKGGAAVLTARGAQATSLGLLTVASPLAVQPTIAHHLIEAMTLPLPERYGDWVAFLQATGLQPKALAVGPGLGEDDSLNPMIIHLAQTFDVPMVLDADGINAFSRHGVSLTALSHTRKAPLVITPHPGEMARLLNCSVDQVQANRLELAMEFAYSNQLWLVLKGAGTVIATPTGKAWINTTGNGALASGGSGDLLTGIIAGLLTQGWPVASAVRAGVWLHGAAADEAVEKKGLVGTTASGLTRYVSRLLNRPPFAAQRK